MTETMLLTQIVPFILNIARMVIIIALLIWLLKRVGFNFQMINMENVHWNIQSLIAILVIGAFSLAALGGMTEGAGMLKDLALVVVGFYFGTQSKTTEIVTPEKKVKIEEQYEIADITKSENDKDAT